MKTLLFILLTIVSIAQQPKKICLVIYKAQDVMEVWGTSSDTYVKLGEMEVCALRHELGPKRRQGDGMTPEGIYKIDLYNPNSAFHLSMRINYPNKSDRILGERGNLGGDIYIHGGCATAGCVAMTDAGIEKLYKLCKKYGKVDVLIFPTRNRDHWISLLSHKTHSKFYGNFLSIWDYWVETSKFPTTIIDNCGNYNLID